MNSKFKTPKQIYLILIILIFLIPYNVVRAQNFEPLREPDVVDISGRKYFPAVKDALDNARESIFLVMYMVGLDERNTNSQVYKLCESLVEAKKRGVRVKVILYSARS